MFLFASHFRNFIVPYFLYCFYIIPYNISLRNRQKSQGARRIGRKVCGNDFAFGPKLVHNKCSMQKYIILNLLQNNLCIIPNAYSAHNSGQELCTCPGRIQHRILYYKFDLLEHICAMYNSINTKKFMSAVLFLNNSWMLFFWSKVNQRGSTPHSIFFAHGYTHKSRIHLSYHTFEKFCILNTLNLVTATINTSLFLLVGLISRHFFAVSICSNLLKLPEDSHYLFQYVM